MRTRNYSLRSLGALSCLLGPVIAVYGIEVPGLSIRQINQFNVQENRASAHAGPPVASLDKLLAEYPFRVAHIDDEVGTLFPEEDSNNQGSDAELTNTDEEGRRANDQEAQSKWGYFALNTAPDKNDSKRIYLLQKDEVGTAYASFTKNLCRKLAKDAFRIANTHKYARTRESTTCLCVVLKDKNKRAKKFVFHNGAAKMPPSMCDEAGKLGYATRTGYQAHAEAEFVEFLLHRNKQNPERYTHMLGMGCSRQHCKECDCLLKLYLGADYHKFTAAMKKEAPESEVAMPIIEELNQDEGDGVRIKVPEEARVFQVAYQKEAIQDKRYPNYRLSEDMQRAIQNKAGLLNLDFSDNRFQIGGAVMARSQKRRKLQGGP
jgi:hypothetical protein